MRSVNNRENPKTLQTSEILSREDRIRRRAYEIWLKHGRPTGSQLRDWLEAESEVAEWEETQKVG